MPFWIPCCGIVRPEVVLDVGANVGQYRQRLRNVGYKGLIISFEALPFLFNELERSALSDPNWKIAPCAALGDVGGWADMNVSANTASSSLLAMREEHSKAAPESRYVRKEQVQVMRLDDPRMLSPIAGPR